MEFHHCFGFGALYYGEEGFDCCDGEGDFEAEVGLEVGGEGCIFCGRDGVGVDAFIGFIFKS